MSESAAADTHLTDLFRLQVKAVDSVPLAQSEMTNSHTIGLSHQKYIIGGAIRVSDGDKGETIEILV